MNCCQIQDALPALVYEELEASSAASVEKHLAECSACRRELAALRHTRGLLDKVPMPAVQLGDRLDVTRLLAADAERQRRQLGDRVRRWRRWALAATAAAAAVLLVAVLPSLELRVEKHQLVLRWGSPPEGVPAAAAPEINAEAGQALQAQLVLLTQLGQGLTETSARDARQRKELRELEAQHRKELDQLRDAVRALQQQAGWRLAALNRDINALYAAVFGVDKKGALE